MPSKRSRKVDSEDEASEVEKDEVVTEKSSAKSAAATAPTPDKQIDAEGNAYFEVRMTDLNLILGL